MNYRNSDIPGKAGRLRYLRDGTPHSHRGGQDPEKRDGGAGRADGEGRRQSQVARHEEDAERPQFQDVWMPPEHGVFYAVGARIAK